MTRAKCAGVARGSATSKRCSMNSACAWFLAKMMVLPSRSPPATLWPSVIRVREHLVDGVVVEQEPVELLGARPRRGCRRPRPIRARPTGPSPPRSGRRSGCPGAGTSAAPTTALRRHEVALGDRLVEAVGVGGDAVLEVEQAVGVVVDLVLRGRGQADEQRVEVVEDRAGTSGRPSGAPRR